MKKMFVMAASLFILNSCGVQSMTKFAEKSTNVFMKGVDATLGGMEWVYNKANGKISEDKIDGKWKIIALYDGDYKTLRQTKNPTNILKTECDQFAVFDTKNKKFQQINCKSEGNPENYTLSFENIDGTMDYDNVFHFGNDESFNIINANGKNMTLEGYFVFDIDTHTTGVYLLEKVK